MKKQPKMLLTAVSAAVMMLFCTVSVYAGQWQKNSTGWWYQNDDGTWPADTWKWIDGNDDGTAESYCFDKNGYLYLYTKTPDGYWVNEDGARTANGAVKTMEVIPRGQTVTAGHVSFTLPFDAVKTLELDSEGNSVVFSSVKNTEEVCYVHDFGMEETAFLMELSKQGYMPTYTSHADGVYKEYYVIKDFAGRSGLWGRASSQNDLDVTTDNVWISLSDVLTTSQVRMIDFLKSVRYDR